MSILYALCLLTALALVYQCFAYISLNNARFKDGLIYGIGATFFVQSLMQDFIGQNAYMAIVASSWVSGWWTVPLALMSLLVMAALLYIGFRIAIPAAEKAQREEKQKKENDNG